LPPRLDGTFGPSHSVTHRAYGDHGRGVYDPLLDAVDVAVRNVDGNVTLTGTVRNYPQYLKAARAARRVAEIQVTG
jgi:hypothetical protein